jgi:hypothetical protein
MASIRVLGSLDTVVRGFIGVCLLTARDIVRMVLTGILTAVIPGFASGPLVGRVGNEIDRILNEMFGWLDSMAAGAASLVSTIPASLNVLLDSVEDAIWNHTVWIRWVARDLIPRVSQRLEAIIAATRSYLMNVMAYEIARVQAWVNVLADALNRRITNEIYAVRLWTTSWINILHRDLQVVRQTVLSYVDRSVTLVRIDLVTTQRNLTAVINSTARALTAYADRVAQVARDVAIRTSLEGARTYTNQQFEALRSALTGIFTKTAAPSWRDVRDAETAILKDFPNGAASLTRKVEAIPKEAPKGLTEIFGGLSATSALSMSWILNAGVPLWRKLRTFSDTVDEMQDDSLIEGIFTLLAFAVLDPGGSAKTASMDMSETLSGVVTGTIGSIFSSDEDE